MTSNVKVVAATMKKSIVYSLMFSFACLCLGGCFSGTDEKAVPTGKVNLLDLRLDQKSEIDVPIHCFAQPLENKWRVKRQTTSETGYAAPLFFCPSDIGFGTLYLDGKEIPKRESGEGPVTELCWEVGPSMVNQPTLGAGTPLGTGETVTKGSPFPIVLDVHPSKVGDIPLSALLVMEVQATTAGNEYPVLSVYADDRELFHAPVVSEDSQRLMVPLAIGFQTTSLRLEMSTEEFGHPVWEPENLGNASVKLNKMDLVHAPEILLHVPAEAGKYNLENLNKAKANFLWLQAPTRGLTSLEEQIVVPPSGNLRKAYIYSCGNVQENLSNVSIPGIRFQSPARFKFPVQFTGAKKVAFSVGFQPFPNEFVFARVTAHREGTEPRLLVQQSVAQSSVAVKKRWRYVALELPEDLSGPGFLQFEFSRNPEMSAKDDTARKSHDPASYLIFGNPRIIYETREGEEPRPNVVLISIDTLRRDHLSCYGYGYETTPNLDKFAKKNVRFENAISPSNWTLPTHRSILSGIPVGQQPISVGKERLQFAHLNLPEKLSREGYATVGFVGGGYVSSDYGLDEGFDLYRYDNGERLEGIYPEVSQWLEEQGSDAPFFLFFHFYDVHSPYGSSKTELRRYFDECGCEYDEKMVDSIYKSQYSGHNYPKKISQKLIHHLVHLYDADIHYTDEYMARFFDLLKQLKLYNNTAIFITSDHGEQFGEHGYWGHHGNLYRELVDVPLIVKFPSSVANKGVVKPLVSTLDIAPTMAELAGAEPPEEWVGVSLAKTFDAPDSGEGREVISEEYYNHGRKVHVFASQIGDEKYIRTFVEIGDPYPDGFRDFTNGERQELYRLDQDPGEKANLAPYATERLRKRHDASEELLSQWRKVQSNSATSREADVSEDVLAALRGLGYIK